MIISTKLMVTGAASLFGVALAAGGVLPGIGAFTIADAPGQVLQVSGVGPASANPSVTAKPQTIATTNAATGTQTTATTNATSGPQTTATTQGSVGRVAPPAAQPLPSYHAVMPSPMASHHSPEPVHSSPGMHTPEH